MLQSGGHRLPLLLQRPMEDRASRAAVPVGRVASVALFAVQVRMHPRAVAVVSGLGCLVRAVPVACAIALQSEQGTCGRFGLGSSKRVGHASCDAKPGKAGSYTGDMPETLVTVRDLTKEYRTPGLPPVTLFRELSFTAGAGEMLAIVGESGAGKSTLLHLLAGLDTPTSGTVEVGGTVVSSLRPGAQAAFRNRAIGYVWQAHYLLPEFTAAENVAMPLLARGTSPAEARTVAVRWLREVGLEHRSEHRAGELSGGEQQRVSLARALVGSPRLLLADEPTGNLDSRSGEAIFALLQSLHSSFGVTTVLVTHNHAFADRCDRALRLGSPAAKPPVPDPLLFPPESVQ